MSESSVPQLTAQCRCGQQSIAMSQPPVAQLVCHCVDCREASGNDFTEIAFFMPEACQAKGQFKEITMPGGSRQPKTYFNCPECGDCVYATVSVLRGQVGVVAGLIEGSIEGAADNKYQFTPRFHCWTSEKAEGVSVPADTIQFTHGPNKPPHMV